MKRFLIFTIAICLLPVVYTSAQDVAIFYDANVQTLGVNNAAGFADMLVAELDSKKITAEIVDSDGLADYMNANPEGIYLVTQGLTKGTIYKNQGKKHLEYSSLTEPGI